MLVAVSRGAGGWWIYSQVIEPYRGYGERRSVRRHSDRRRVPTASASGWSSAGVVRDPLTFRAALLISGRARALKAGEYRFDAPMHALDVIDKIARGDVYKRLLTFREGLTIAEMAQVFEEQGLWQRPPSFIKAAANATLDRRSRSGGARSRRLPVSGNLLAAARHAGHARSSRRWWRASRTR